MLEPFGWKPVHRRGEEIWWRRPGKDKGWSATTGHCKGLKVFSSSTQFATDGTYTKFGAFTVLQFGGDFKACTKALAENGYGTWIDNDGTEKQNPAPKDWQRSGRGNESQQSGLSPSNNSPSGEVKPVQATGIEVPIPIQEWPDPPEGEAFHELAGLIVNLIAPSTEADPVGLLLQLLVGFGNAVGRGAWVEADGCRHHANEFAVIVGETSRARKGTSEKRVRPVWAYADPDWAAKKITHGLSSGEGLIWEIRDPILGTDKKTKQEVEIDPGVDDKRVLVIESEFGSVLRVLARDGNTLSSVLRLAWDSDDLRTMTKNNPARASSPHVSLIGHITQQELLKYLASVEVFNGLGNRHLWACVRRSKLLPFGGAATRRVYHTWVVFWPRP